MSDAYTAAVYLLSQREHGEQELLQKLITKGYALQEVHTVLEKCKNLNIQSDTRYTENLCRARIRQGYGPLKIRQELLNKGIAGHLIEETLEQESEHWYAHALAVWKKKGKMEQGEETFATIQKKQRFLLYRGFPASLIAEIAKSE